MTDLTDTEAAHLRRFLDALLVDTDHASRLESDPVGLVRRFDRRADLEIVALLSSSLAYGRVALVRRAILSVLDLLGDRPAEAIEGLDPNDLEPFVYRMTRGADLYDLLFAARRAQLRWGSLEACYSAMNGTDHVERAGQFVRQLHELRHREPLARGLRYLLSDPGRGSATKRLHMFFRWMARLDDGVDLGIWTAISPSELIMPLDTHTSRLCRYLGLVGRKSVDLIAAVEVSDSLRRLRPEDPLIYDFALAHLGISGRCIHERSDIHCPGCPIEPVCGL